MRFYTDCPTETDLTINRGQSLRQRVYLFYIMLVQGNITAKPNFLANQLIILDRCFRLEQGNWVLL